ncbi:glutenin, high molecular weight subunit PW212-like isoform X2 [Cimex lectularius]|uniref:Peptidase S1 domain-containing protein n=1 Tax=Cimex lectularius TaxID=79782 RepID=A0A8I6SRV2_CIMLE|nr:glutenin, high molecular weight subunit PW212-like isoform X2 [Cimex lectularius]
MKTIILLGLVFGAAVGQYGPPKQTGPKKHRTTTTEPPNEANEIQPTVYEESGVLPDGGNYHAKVTSHNQPGLSVSSHSYTLSGPNPNQFLNQSVSSNQPGGCGVTCNGQNQRPIDISKNPFLSAGLSGVPVTSRPFSPPLSQHPNQPQNKPSGNPFLPPNFNQQFSSSQPQPNFPQSQNPHTGHPNVQPSRPGYPNQPLPGQSQNQHPGHPNGQPSQPGFPNQPLPGQGQPQNPHAGHPSGQPSQPGFPNQPFPGQGQPQPPHAGHPNVQPSQPGFPNQPFPGQGQPQNPQAGHPNAQPSQPGFPNQPFPGQGQPQNPQAGHPNAQPSRPGYPNQPLPGQGQPQPPHAGHPNVQPSQSGFPNQPFPGQGQPQTPHAGLPNVQPSNQNQQPFHHGQKPHPGFPNQLGQTEQPGQQPGHPGQTQYGNPLQQPNQPGQFQPQQQPKQPVPFNQQPAPGFTPQQPSGQPQNPQTSGQQPQPGFPRQPYQAQPQQYPSQSFNSAQPSQPGGTYNCNGQHQFCVPQFVCSNGYIGDKSPNAASTYRKGQCNAGEVCCKLPTSSQPNHNYVTEAPQQKYTGPLNTTPPPGCAAALKCVQEIYCTVEGVMSDVPVALSREQTENKVPLTDCQNPDTGVLGKCCRDPNYKDPWPAGMMMPQRNSGFDDGQYHPNKYPGEKPANVPKVIPNFNPQRPNQPQGQGNQFFPQQVTISPPNPHTIKKPLGAFNTVVTPFPVSQPVHPDPHGFGPNGNTFVPSGPTVPQVPGGNSYDQNKPQPSQNNNLVGSPGNLNPNGPSSPSGQTPFRPQGNAPPANQPFDHNRYSQLQPSSSPQYNSPSSGSLVSPGEKCGVRRPPYSALTYTTGFGEFPWHVVILSSGNRSALCSGAIIAPNAVLTAAHCIDGISPEDMVVKAGEWTLDHPGDRPTQMRVVAASAIHPVYSAGSLVKDQAVLVTEKPFSFDVHVDKVCLPAPGGTYTPSTTTCFLTGWGRPALQNNQPGSSLNKVPINITPKDECEQSLKKTHLGKYFILNEGFTCAAPFNENDLCKVDIGSPLVCERPDGQYELAGVYSWDTKCSSNLPGVMATCDPDWIKQVLATPIETLKQQARPKFKDAQLPEDIDSKPGFALGYGK